MLLTTLDAPYAWMLAAEARDIMAAVAMWHPTTPCMPLTAGSRPTVQKSWMWKLKASVTKPTTSRRRDLCLGAVPCTCIRAGVKTRADECERDRGGGVEESIGKEDTALHIVVPVRRRVEDCLQRHFTTVNPSFVARTPTSLAAARRCTDNSRMRRVPRGPTARGTSPRWRCVPWCCCAGSCRSKTGQRRAPR